MPLVDVEFFDFAVEIFDLDQLVILVEREHAEGFLLLDVLVPLTRDWFLVSAHDRHPSTGN